VLRSCFCDKVVGVFVRFRAPLFGVGRCWLLKSADKGKEAQQFQYIYRMTITEFGRSSS
jgi:hypothetical protein